MYAQFYGRHSKNGEWFSYEDIVQQHNLVGDAKQDLDSVKVKGGSVGFNGFKTILKKAAYAAEQQLGGLMIWEVDPCLPVHA